MKKLATCIASLLVGFIVVFSVSVPVFAATGFDPLDKSCEGAPTSDVCQDINSAATGDPINGVLILATNIVAIAAGVIAVILIILSGISLTLSSGDSAKATKDRNAIIYASVGIIVIVLARTIVLYVFSLIG